MSQSERKKSPQEKRKEARYSPYTKGVKNDYGETVIRPMTNEEKQFLEKFNQEFVDNNFTETNLHDDLIEKSAKEVASIKKQLNKLKSEFKKLNNTGYVNAKGEERIALKQATNKNQRDKDSIQKEIRRLKDLLIDKDIKANINHSNF